MAGWIALFGHPRLAAVVTAALSVGVLADAARVSGARHWAWLPALALGTPLGFSLFIATPDGPLVLAGAVLVRAVVGGHALGAGLALGAALWCKSAALVAVPGLVWALGVRRGLGAVAVGAAVYAPHIGWSLSHAGWPWTFQAGLRRWGTFGLPEALGGQLLVLTPWLAWHIVRCWRRPADARTRQLGRLGWPILLAWMALAVVVRVEANWPALAWLPGLVVLVHQPIDTWWRAHRWALGLTVVAAVAVAGLGRWAPLGMGPPRDGPRWGACLAEAAPDRALVTGRYQSRALLQVAGVATTHRRAKGHRGSWFDGRTPPPPPCDFIYLGPPERVPACAGTLHPSTLCGQVATECRCVGDRRRPGPV